LWGERQPEPILRNEGIGKEKELSGDSDKGAFGLFSVAGESLVECLHIAVMKVFN
jgi:hypothetical protein